jgi:hypothetical protein
MSEKHLEGRRGFLKALGLGALGALVVKPEVAEAAVPQIPVEEGPVFAWGSEPLTDISRVTHGLNVAAVPTYLTDEQLRDDIRRVYGDVRQGLNERVSPLLKVRRG